MTAEGRNVPRVGGTVDPLSAVAAYLNLGQDERAGAHGRSCQRAAVKELLAELAELVPGNSVELRVPPYGVIQIIAGPRHRRGQPSATIEMDSQTLIGLCLGEIGWQESVSSGKVLASGERADLSNVVPLRLSATESAISSPNDVR